MAVSAGLVIQHLARFSLTTANAEQLALFYENTFGCRRLAIEYVSGAAFEALMGAKGGALRIKLSLGEQIVELLQFDQQGRPYPQNRSASDLIFQHFAIVVSDMGQAYRRLSAIEGWTAISCGGPQLLPQSSGGVTAFKFSDPEGHPLEFLFFPKGAMPARWREKQNDELCRGIDHSAISVSDTAQSISFYENLGLQISSHSINHGTEQEHLDDIAGVRVEVTALEPRWPGPHLELLCYGANAHIGELPFLNTDIATTRLIFTSSNSVAPREVVDPDGHHLIIGG
jgi:catechol 2,3-dioxygenase-like lactoylglutathione lyase family enzyme